MNKIVRRWLDDDCLLDGQLHPSIAERLQRVRELPLSNAANFHGVQRDSDGVWLMWEFVPGITLEQFLSEPHDPSECDRIAAELRRAVYALHASGIVHGALHARNVIIDPRGRLHLTHISPLLWSDTMPDERAMKQMLSALGASTDAMPLPADEDDSAERRARRDAYLLTFAAAMMAMLIFVVLLWYTRT